MSGDAAEVKTPPEWLLIRELAQLPCLAASGWPHDGCFSCRAKALRDEREGRPLYPTPRPRELVPRDPGNPPEAITRKDERGATWTLKWQALYEGGMGEERYATAGSLMAVGFQPDRSTTDLTGEAMRDCIDYLHRNDGFRSLRVRVFDGEIKLEILTAAKGLDPIAEAKGSLFHDAVATLKDEW